MKNISVLLSLVFLAGCTLLRQEEPLPLYTLKSDTIERTGLLSAPLAIDMPLSEASLDTTRIAMTPSPYQRDYMADGQWPDKLPRVLQEFLIEGLTQRWGGTYVNRTGTGLLTQYILQSEILDFSVHYLDTDHPEVHVKIIFKILDLRNRKVIDDYMFAEKVQISSLTMRGIVEGFNKGLHHLLREAAAWMESVFLLQTNDRK